MQGGRRWNGFSLTCYHRQLLISCCKFLLSSLKVYWVLFSCSLANMQPTVASGLAFRAEDFWPVFANCGSLILTQPRRSLPCFAPPKYKKHSASPKHRESSYHFVFKAHSALELQRQCSPKYMIGLLKNLGFFIFTKFEILPCSLSYPKLNLILTQNYTDKLICFSSTQMQSH